MHNKLIQNLVAKDNKYLLSYTVSESQEYRSSLARWCIRYADDTTLIAESEEEIKNLLMRVKEESEKANLKFNIQKTKIMTSGPITSWEIDGEIMETVTDFIFLGSKITAEGDCSLLLGRSMTNLDSILKNRDITLLTKVHIVKAMVFPVVMYGCESWTIKKAEHQRTDAFKLWY